MGKLQKHKMAGVAVKIEEGPFKGQYFKVIDYMENQFQGKSIEKIATFQATLVTPVVGRGYPLDDKIVFGQLYPAMTFMCVHDDELRIKTAQPPLKIVEEEKEIQDDTGTTDQGNSVAAGTGSTEPDGRTVPSAKLTIKDGGKGKKAGKTN